MAATKTPQPLEGPASLPNMFVGTSGWAYPTWKPDFYPADLTARRFLPFYASCLNSVEVNYTFRALPKPASVAEWLASTPPGFRFSFKAPQRITHFNRLVDCEASLGEFLNALRPVRLAGKLGVVLFQLPPNFKADLPRLDAFLSAQILKRPRGVHVAFEFRHASWFDDATYKVLRRHQAALCIAESDDLCTPEVHPSPLLACFRLRRNGGYTQAEVQSFAARFAELAKTRTVYAYLKHEDQPTGALNATALLQAAAAMAAGTR